MSAHHLDTGARFGLIGAIAFGVVTMLATASWSKIIRYIDAAGVIWFTNIPSPPDRRDGHQAAGEAQQPGRTRHLHDDYPYRAVVERLARQHALNPELVRALIAVESNFDSTAISPKGAQGLMQLMPVIAQYYRVYNPLNPAENIEGGIRYLSDLLRLFDNRLPLAIAAYNAGEGLVRQHGGVPPFLEAYVNRVLALFEQARGTSIHRYLLPSGVILFSNVPLSQERLGQWEVKK